MNTGTITKNNRELTLDKLSSCRSCGNYQKAAWECGTHNSGELPNFLHISGHARECRIANNPNEIDRRAYNAIQDSPVKLQKSITTLHIDRVYGNSLQFKEWIQILPNLQHLIIGKCCCSEEVQTAILSMNFLVSLEIKAACANADLGVSYDDEDNEKARLKAEFLESEIKRKGENKVVELKPAVQILEVINQKEEEKEDMESSEDEVAPAPVAAMVPVAAPAPVKTSSTTNTKVMVSILSILLAFFSWMFYSSAQSSAEHRA